MNDLQELEAQFTALTDEWMSTIGVEHHKDRDCHFRIERVWSYGNAPYWEASHYGYWIDRFEQKCPTYRDAVLALIGMLTEELASAQKSIQEAA